MQYFLTYCCQVSSFGDSHDSSLLLYRNDFYSDFEHSIFICISRTDGIKVFRMCTCTLKNSPLFDQSRQTIQSLRQGRVPLVMLIKQGLQLLFRCLQYQSTNCTFPFQPLLIIFEYQKQLQSLSIDNLILGKKSDLLLKTQCNSIVLVCCLSMSQLLCTILFKFLKKGFRAPRSHGLSPEWIEWL